MRLLALILNILISASLLLHASKTLALPVNNDSSHFEFQRESTQRPHNVAKSKRVHHSNNIWERIRLGMQIQLPNTPITVVPNSNPLIKTNELLSTIPPAFNNRSHTDEFKKDNPLLTKKLIIRSSTKEMGRINAILIAATETNATANGIVVADNSDNAHLQITASPLTIEQQELAKKQQVEKQLAQQEKLEKEKVIYERVNKHIVRYVQNKAYLYEVTERARPYLYHIVNSLNQYQLPSELALLPIVESAYQPTAQSSKSAAGLWQFIPSTGLDFDLKQTQHYDDRLDITASTQAAMRYLSFLKRHFKGDWLLAIAAYNCGLGAVDEAIKKNTVAKLATDYWSLDLPEETQDYVPRLLALSSIFADPARYNVKFAPIKNEPYFIQVRIERDSDVQYLSKKSFNEIAGLANLSYEQFNLLNPGYLQVGLAKENAFTFLMPAANANLLHRRLSSITKFTESDNTIAMNAPSKFRATIAKTALSLYNPFVTKEKLASPFISLNVNANKTTPRIKQQPLVNALLTTSNTLL